jgi:serine/threonine protein kinase
MELIDGSNLSERIQREMEKGIQFQEKELWKVLINMCSVLQYLHYESNIIHRDINPTNILVDNDFNVKLADFGLAKTFTPSIKINQSFVGTPAYSW